MKRKHWIGTGILGGLVAIGVNMFFPPKTQLVPSSPSTRSALSPPPTTPKDPSPLPLITSPQNSRGRPIPYEQYLRAELLAGMPQGTHVNITRHTSQFVERLDRKGHQLADILSIETTLPDGRRYAYNASYDPRSRSILRTWGGGRHDSPQRDTFTPPSP